MDGAPDLVVTADDLDSVRVAVHVGPERAPQECVCYRLLRNRVHEGSADEAALWLVGGQRVAHFAAEYVVVRRYVRIRAGAAIRGERRWVRHASPARAERVLIGEARVLEVQARVLGHRREGRREGGGAADACKE